MTPSRISRRIALVKPSPTIAMSERAAQLRKEGRSIISFALGEPDFDTPALVNFAAIAAIEQGQTRYTATAGTPALRHV
jgi:aspartate aminotransferase